MPSSRRRKDRLSVIQSPGLDCLLDSLPDRIGVTRQTVNAIEGGKHSPSLEVAFRIARVFGKLLRELFEYEADGREARPSTRSAGLGALT